MPVSIDGKAMDGETVVRHLNELAGLHGIGRIDMVEDRLVGIKSREIYESPAAVTLLAAHEALEHMTLSKPQLRLKERVAQEYADLIYNGLWFTAHHQDMAAYVRSTQRYVTGEVRVRLHKGTATPVGRKAEHSLYSYALATYDRGDQFDQGSAPGFIDLWGLPVRVQAEAQLLTEPGSPCGSRRRRSRARVVQDSPAIRSYLQDFVLDSTLSDLEQQLSPFNIFEAVGAVRYCSCAHCASGGSWSFMRSSYSVIWELQKRLRNRLHLPWEGV